jgi:hypothetical protein
MRDKLPNNQPSYPEDDVIKKYPRVYHYLCNYKSVIFPDLVPPPNGVLADTMANRTPPIVLFLFEQALITVEENLPTPDIKSRKLITEMMQYINRPSLSVVEEACKYLGHPQDEEDNNQNQLNRCYCRTMTYMKEK